MNSVLIKEKKLLEGVFPEEDIPILDPLRIPKHIAIMMDGNRRWAARKKLPLIAGHVQGVEVLVQIVQIASKLGIETLTVYAFSTENWMRIPSEVQSLMHLFKTSIAKQKKTMVEEGIRLDVIGDISKLPSDVQKALQNAIMATKEGKKLNLVIALNYGARDELRRAICAIVKDCNAGKLSIESIDEKKIASYLDTAKWKDPDLLIRTSGESRISNFLLWQISYSELLTTKVLWPDFTKVDFLKAILEYQKRELRLGR